MNQITAMTYETIDWDAEAKRISDAFGLCDGVFVKAFDESTQKTFINGWLTKERVIYDTDFRCYEYYDFPSNPTRIYLNWQGKVCFSPKIGRDGGPLIVGKALFRLGLLSDEVAEILGISAHQKIEWELECHARLEALKGK